MVSIKDSQGVVWDWTPEQWRWTPSDGPWNPELGGPDDLVSLTISTDGIPPKETYDFWCETVFHNFTPEKRATNSGEFRACAHASVAPRGDFYIFQSDEIAGGRTASQAWAEGNTDIDIGLVIKGVRRHELADGQQVASQAGEVFVYDPIRPSRVKWSAHRGIQLKLRRRDVEAAAGGKLPSEDALVRTLSTSPLWPFLRAQMVLLGRRLPKLPPRARTVVLNHTIDLALVTLHESVSPALTESTAVRHGLFLAAQRYIDDHLSDPQLGVDDIARAIACSRATLYRTFAEHNWTVAGYIREQRLQRLALMLQRSDIQTPIATLAELCGLCNLANLSRVFRDRFGLRPREARQQWRQPKE